MKTIMSAKTMLKGISIKRTLLGASLFLSCTLNAQTGLPQPQTSGSVTVKQLYTEFHNNFVSAKQKYEGKTLMVTGKIYSIHPTSDNKVFLYLTATDFDSYVECLVDNNDKISVLSKGQDVTVTGTLSRIFAGATGYLLFDPAMVQGPVASKPANENKPKNTNPVSTPANPPMGEYAVYQMSGSSFGYSYRFTLMANGKYHQYDSDFGTYTYNPKTKVITFTSGPMEGYKGIYYTKGRNNDKGEPVIAIDFEGKVPDLSNTSNGQYQYAYFRPNGV